jgi:hypothetical protein
MGLPADDDARHAMVAPKLSEIMEASMLYVFSDKRMVEDGQGPGVDRTTLFEGIVDACARACVVTGDFGFLFEELYERFLDNGIEPIFLRRIESFILSGQIRSVPPQLLQSLLTAKDDSLTVEDAESIIFNVDASALDIDVTLGFCRRNHLYDALIYVFTKALMDYSSPLIEMLSLIETVEAARVERPADVGDESVVELSFEAEAHAPDAYRLFLFLTATFSNVSYPTQQPLPDEIALLAKESLCDDLFSFTPPSHPGQASKVQQTSPYPYLSLLLRFDAEATLDWLDQAFEDPWLNEGRYTRQEIVDILLAISEERLCRLLPSDTIFIYTYLAHNLPKYSV